MRTLVILNMLYAYRGKYPFWPNILLSGQVAFGFQWTSMVWSLSYKATKLEWTGYKRPRSSC